MATYSFAAKKVLVTGGANGLGKEVVKKFLETGATVIAVDRDSEALRKLSKECGSALLITSAVDLSDWEATKIAIEGFLPVHHLVNNAGISRPMPFLDVTEADLDMQFGVNFKAAFNVSQIFARGIQDHGIMGGTIVTISSVIDRLGAPMFTAYSCSKAALTMLSRGLAAELAPLNIRCNVIRPDLMKTDMFAKFAANHPEASEGLLEKTLERSRLKKILEPTDILGLVLFLSSEDSGMITGVDVAVDGGATA